MGSLAKLFTKAGSKGGRRAAQPSSMTTYEIGDATKLKTGGGRRPAVPGKRKLSDIDLEEIDEGIEIRKAAAPKPRRKAPSKPMSRTPKTEQMQGAYDKKKAELQKLQARAKNLSKGPELTAIKEKIQLVTNAMEGIAKRNSSIKRNKGGKVLYKKHGGMSHVGLSPAEEARSGTMSEAKRARYMQAGGPIRTTFPRRADPRTEGRAPAVDLFPKVERKKSGKVGKKAGKGKGKGKIKRISSKQTDGNKLVSSLYD